MANKNNCRVVSGYKEYVDRLNNFLFGKAEVIITYKELPEENANLKTYTATHCEGVWHEKRYYEVHHTSANLLGTVFNTDVKFHITEFWQEGRQHFILAEPVDVNTTWSEVK